MFPLSQKLTIMKIGHSVADTIYWRKEPPQLWVEIRIFDYIMIVKAAEGQGILGF